MYTTNCILDCNASAPIITDINRDSVSSATVNWTPGANGTSERLYIGANKSEVEANCPDTGSPLCVVQDEPVTPTVNPDGTHSFSVGGLVTGTTYYVRVVTYQSGSCSANSSTTRYLSSCLLSPSSISMTSDQPAQTLTASLVSSSEIERVDFTSTDPAIVTVNPASDTSYQYQTSVTPVTLGTTSITEDVYFTGPTLACSGSVPVNIITPYAWWQVRDSDIASMGDLVSRLPGTGGFFFSLPGLGGFPGVAAYGGTTNLDIPSVSETGWLAQSSSLSTRIFDYNFFANQVPADVVPTDASGGIGGAGASFYGYEWFKIADSDVNIESDIDLADRKVILLIENGNLNLNAKVNLNDGTGFFLAVVGGNININSAVGGGVSPDIEGLFIADGTISTGTTGAVDIPLWVRGSMAGYTGILMQRDLEDANSDGPAELFEYAPDQILLFPSKLGYRRLNWKEVAP